MDGGPLLLTTTEGVGVEMSTPLASINHLTIILLSMMAAIVSVSHFHTFHHHALVYINQIYHSLSEHPSNDIKEIQLCAGVSQI